MNKGETMNSTDPPTDPPITEKTKAILDAIEAFKQEQGNKLQDVTTAIRQIKERLQDDENFKEALYRSLTTLAALIKPKHKT